MSVDENKNNTTNSKVKPPLSVSQVARQFQNIENLYSSLTSSLINMQDIDKKNIFSYILLGGYQDDLMTNKTIDLKDLTNEQRKVFQNFLSASRNKRLNTDYAFQPEYKDTKVHIPYLAILDIMEDILTKCNPADQEFFLSFLKKNFDKTQESQRKQSTKVSWTMIAIGGVGSMITLTCLIVPNVFTLTESVAKGLTIAGYVSATITGLFIVISCINRISKGVKKMNIDEQSNTIKKLAKKIKDRKTDLNKQHNSIIDERNNNLATDLAKKGLQNFLSKHQALQTNTNSYVSNINNNNPNMSNIKIPPSVLNKNTTQTENQKNDNITNIITNNNNKNDGSLISMDNINEQRNNVNNSSVGSSS